MDAAARNDDPADLFLRLTQLNDIGVALSRETDIARLLEAILVAAKTITNADGGTLYRVTDERTLEFEILRNDTLGVAMGGTTGAPIPFYPIALYDHEGAPVTSMVAAYAVHHASRSTSPMRTARKASISPGPRASTRRRATVRARS